MADTVSTFIDLTPFPAGALAHPKSPGGTSMLRKLCGFYLLVFGCCSAMPGAGLWLEMAFMLC
jgi:hypothetical protein